MKVDALKLLFASLAVSSFVFAGCAADPTDGNPDADEPEDVGSSQDEIQARALQFVGDFEWSAADSGGFVDFKQLSLKKDGKYTAQVDSKLVDTKVACIALPCTLPEAGTWTTVKVGGKLKVRVDPTGASPSRSYFASIAGNTLSLTRFGKTTKLFKEPTLTCANVRCKAGTHCEMKGINGGSVPVCVKDTINGCAATLCAPGTRCVDGDDGPQCLPIPTCAVTLCMVGTTCVDKPTGAECVPNPTTPCVKTGCSGQICADGSRFSTCEFRPEYACYATATCERQSNGQCGWTKTPELTSCLGGS